MKGFSIIPVRGPRVICSLVLRSLWSRAAGEILNNTLPALGKHSEHSSIAITVYGTCQIRTHRSSHPPCLASPSSRAPARRPISIWARGHAIGAVKVLAVSALCASRSVAADVAIGLTCLDWGSSHSKSNGPLKLSFAGYGTPSA